MDQLIRVLVTKPVLNGLDREARVNSRAQRDAGMEAVIAGSRPTPEIIVNAAFQKDAQVIDSAMLSGVHNAIVPRDPDLLQKKKMTDVVVIVGGIVPDDDAEYLKQPGVATVSQSQSHRKEIVGFTLSSVEQHAPSLRERK